MVIYTYATVTQSTQICTCTTSLHTTMTAAAVDATGSSRSSRCPSPACSRFTLRLLLAPWRAVLTEDHSRQRNRCTLPLELLPRTALIVG